MAGTFSRKTRVLLSAKVLPPAHLGRDLNEAALLFKQAAIQNSSLNELDPDLAVKIAMSGGLAGNSTEDTDGKKRTNSGGTPGMDEYFGYRYMPNEKYGPGKVLKLFPSQAQRDSMNKTPNFGFVDEKPMTIEEYTESLKKEPVIRMAKYKVNPRTGQVDESTEEEIDPFRFGKTKDQIKTKNLGGRKLSSLVRGGGLVARSAARFGVIVDELGKMRCPPGTPAANQFTDMTGSNCFGSPGSIVRASVDAARNLIEDESSTRAIGKRIANFIFDWDNSPLGRTVWYDQDGNRIKNYRKWREQGGVAEGERWFADGMARGVRELENQDARIEELFKDLGVSRSATNMENNNDLLQALDKLRKAGVTNATLGNDKMGRPSDAQVRNLLIGNLQRTPGWEGLSPQEKNNLLKADTQRYYEIERGLVEAFLDEVIKNPEHMKSISSIGYSYSSTDEASWNPQGIIGGDVMEGVININIPFIMKRQESMLPNLSPDERLKIYAEGGISDSANAIAHNDFLLNVNAYAGQMAAMIDGPRTHARQIMKHEIAHSIQGSAISNAIRDQINRDGFITIPSGKREKEGLKKVSDPSELTSADIIKIMTGYGSIDLEALQSVASRSETVAFLAGRYITELRSRGEADGLITLEIGAELWALRASGLVYGDDVDAALAWMDDIADGRYAEDRRFNDNLALLKINDSYTKGTERLKKLGIDSRKDEYIASRKEEIKAHKLEVKSMTDEELLDDIIDLRDQVKALGKQVKANPKDFVADARYDVAYRKLKDSEVAYRERSSVSPSTSRAYARMDSDIKERMTERGLKTDEEVIDEMDEAEVDRASEIAKTYDLDRLAEEVASLDSMLKDKELDKERKKQLRKVREEFKKEYIDRRTSSPDYPVSEEDAEKSLNTATKRITDLSEARKSKEPAKFRSHQQTLDYADKEREELFSEISTRERIAIVEMGDPSQHDIGRLLDPRTQFEASKAIQARHRQLQKSGAEIAADNKNQSSIEDQIENILAPFMESMDKTRLKDTVEVEAEIVLPQDIELDAVFSNEGFVSGRMLTSRKPHSPDASGTRIPGDTPLESRKVLVRAKEGNKGIFTNWSFEKEVDDGQQKVVFPPGKLKVVDKTSDGTIVVEVVEQKNTEQVLDGLAKTSAPIPGETKDNFVWRESINSKIVRSVARSLHRKRRSGSYEKGETPPAAADKILIDNDAVSAGIKPYGKGLGEPVSRDYIQKEEVRAVTSDSSATSRFGVPQTRQERKTDREELQREVISDIRSAINTSGDRSISVSVELSDIDPEVAQLVESLTDEEIMQIVNNSARDFHLQFDSRPRVRVTEEELRPISNGSWYGFNGSGPIDPGLMTPMVGFSSGRSERFEIPGVGLADRNGLSSGLQIEKAASSIRPKKERRSTSRTTTSSRTGLSSGATVKESDLPIKSRTITSSKIVEGSDIDEFGAQTGNQKVLASKVFDIGGESVVFGASDDLLIDDPNIKKMPLNPFEISGLNPSSEEGKTTAEKWIKAIHGLESEVIPESEEFDSGSYVSALLYASTKGDNNAKRELDRLESLSNSIVEKVKKERQDRAGNIDERSALPLSSQLVHQTSFKPQVDKDGFLVLKPLEDFPQTSESGESVTVNRGTLHFSINHLAEGHSLRTEAKGKSYVVVSSLGDVIDQNKDGIENISVVDTALTAPPNGGIRLAPGTFKILEINEGDNARAKTEEAIRASGSPIFTGGEVESTPEQDKQALARAALLGVSSATASNLPLTPIEMVNRTNKNQLLRQSKVPADTNLLSTASRNALLRIANRKDNSWISSVEINKDRRTSLSSGSTVERNLPPGALEDSPSFVKSKPYNMGPTKMYRPKSEVYTVDGKKIAFGSQNDLDDPDVEIIPINPYEISGFSPDSEEGRQIADDWLIARAMHDEENQTYGQSSYVDALLYAASRGDENAKEKLDALTAKGRERLQQERAAIDTEVTDTDKEIREQAIRQEDLQNVNIDQIFLVHETKWDTQTDEDGNIIIKPASDYDLLDENGEKLKDADGDDYDLYRGTVHFSLNHLVDGHMARGSLQEGNVIIVPLKSVLEANPDSLDVLYPVDTFLTPPPGQGLKLPGARVVKNNGQEGVKGEVWKTMEEMGATRSFTPGERYSSQGAEALIQKLSEELGINRGIAHSETPHFDLEKARKKNQQTLSTTFRELARMSRNARIRVANNNRFAPSNSNLFEDESSFVA